MQMQTVVSETPEALAHSVAVYFTEKVNEILNDQESCSIALSGGVTPHLVFSLLADEPYKSLIAWDRLYFFWGDERCVPPEHPESNFRTAWEGMLYRVPVQADHVYRMPADQFGSDEAAQAYENTLRDFFKTPPPGFPRFDLLFLGMGADGHVASLFPGSGTLDEKSRCVVPVPADEDPQKLARLTLTLPVLNHARNVLFVVQGSNKAWAVKTVLEGNRGAKGGWPLPAQRIQPLEGSLHWFLDRTAAASLSLEREKHPVEA